MDPGLPRRILQVLQFSAVVVMTTQYTHFRQFLPAPLLKYPFRAKPQTMLILICSREMLARILSSKSESFHELHSSDGRLHGAFEFFATSRERTSHASCGLCFYRLTKIRENHLERSGVVVATDYNLFVDNARY